MVLSKVRKARIKARARMRAARRKAKATPRRLVTRVRRLEKGIETKIVDLFFSGTVSNVRHSGTSPNYNTYVLNVMSQGTDYTQRVGKEITMKALELQFHFKPAATAAFEEHYFVWLGWCKEWDSADQSTFDPQSSTPGTEGIWIDTSATVAATAIMPPRRWFSRREYRTIKYRQFHASACTGTAPYSLGTIPYTIQRKWHINLKRKSATYNQNTGSSTDIKNNALVLVVGFVRDDNSVASPPTFTVVSRLKFTDS